MNQEEQGGKLGRIIAKAWDDEAYKTRLLTDPKTVLREEGIEVPDRLEVRIFENSEDVFNFVLPPKPATTTIISDDQLEDIAGGSQCRYMLIAPGHAIM